MTLLDERQVLDPGTGPILGDNPVRPLAAPAHRSSVVPEAGAEILERARKLRSQWGKESSEKVALLGILLAQLAEVPFEDTAALLDVRLARLERLMHGEEQIPARAAERWRMIAETLDDLQAVLKPRATARWLRTAIPALDGRTPLEAAKRGRLADVRALTASYRDQAFA